MSCYDRERESVIWSLIADIDEATKVARRDQQELNKIARYLRQARETGKISDVHYTIDQERLQRTLAKCKAVLLKLTRHRRQAIELLNK